MQLAESLPAEPAVFLYMHLHLMMPHPLAVHI